MKAWKIRWVPALALSFLLAFLIALLVWAGVAANRGMDIRITALERQGLDKLTDSSVVASLLLVLMLLAIVHLVVTVFRPKYTGDLSWLYQLLFAMLIFLALQVFLQFVFTFMPGHIFYERHPVYFVATARSTLIVILLTLGIGIYLVRHHSKLVYGIAEIVVSVATNIGIIAKLDLSRFPSMPLHGGEFVALGALAYLLSKGISDAVDGVGEIKAKRLKQS